MKQFPGLTDLHCHMQDEKLRPHLNDAFKNATSRGITGFFCCATDESDWQDVLDLANRYEQVIPAIGIHPWKTETVSDEWQERMAAILQHHTDCCIGEIGLDLHFAKDTIEAQKQVFIDQLEIAREYRRPVSIHCLKAWHLLVPILKEFDDVTVMLHSYNGSMEITQQLSPLPRVYFSFSGNILNTKKSLLNVIRTIPEKRILIETDSPFLLPDCPEIHNKEYNEPANFVYVLRRIAEIREISEDELKMNLQVNTNNFFKEIFNAD